MMHKSGVEFLAGTDVPNPFCFPGFSLHDELDLLVQAGLAPLEALKTATINPARYFGMEKTLGTIEAGKLADLVLLDGNPLQAIANTQKINSVVINGRLHGRKALDRLLIEVEADASRKSVNQ
jgi:imidazolonepropionase-like amidohydrolase